MKPAKIFRIGDRVAYSAAWLRSTGTFSGDIPFLRGNVVNVSTYRAGVPQVCTIMWTLDGKPYWISSEYHKDGLGRVLASNLTAVSRLALDAM